MLVLLNLEKSLKTFDYLDAYDTNAMSSDGAIKKQKNIQINCAGKNKKISSNRK